MRSRNSVTSWHDGQVKPVIWKCAQRVNRGILYPAHNTVAACQWRLYNHRNREWDREGERVIDPQCCSVAAHRNSSRSLRGHHVANNSLTDTPFTGGGTLYKHRSCQVEDTGCFCAGGRLALGGLRLQIRTDPNCNNVLGIRSEQRWGAHCTYTL